MDSIKVSLDPGAFTPERAHTTDAGIDLKTPKKFVIRKGERKAINTGVHVEIPEGYVGLLMPKSGLNVKYGILSHGVIDAGYSGEIVVQLYMLGEGVKVFEAGDKITQLVISPLVTPKIEVVSQISSGDRGDSGFGSSGN